MPTAVKKAHGNRLRKRVSLALRVAAVVISAVVIGVAAAVRPSFGPVGLGITAIATLIAGSVAAVGIKAGGAALYWRTVGRHRSTVARHARGDIGSTAMQGSGTALATYLRDRLVAGAGGPPLVIVTGSDERGLAQVVRQASASLGPEVQLIEPLGDDPDDVRAFATWLVEGADENLLPRGHARSEATLFLLGDLDAYRGTGLEADRLEPWRDAVSPRLALATALRRRSSTRAGPEWSNDLFRRARVISVAGDPGS